MEKSLLLEKTALAKTQLAEAETELESVLRTLTQSPRAEKTTITAVVERAFAKLKAARAALGELEQMIAPGSGD